MIPFSGSYASRLALNILKAFDRVIIITRQSGQGKELAFFEQSKGTLDRAKFLADMVRSEVEKVINEGLELQSHLAMLQKLENQIVTLRELLVSSIRMAKKNLYSSEVLPMALQNSVRNVGRIIKDIIITAKDIEQQFPKETGSVLDAITHGRLAAFGKQGATEDNAEAPEEETVMEEDQTTPLAEPDKDKEKKDSGDETEEEKADELVPRQSTIRIGNRVVVELTPEMIQQKLEEGIELFNTKWKKGLQFLISERIIKEETRSIASFLYDHNERLSKEQMGEILAGKNEGDIELITEFTALMDFKGDSFDDSLRKYLKKFMLPGEAQKISRIMEVFAAEYLNQNPGIFPNNDVAFVLAFSLIMLNTDAHNPAIAPKDKMTKEQFLWNNRGTWVDGADPPKELLEELYDKIVSDEISMQTKGDPDKKGWIKAIHAGSIKEGRRWFVLVGNELRWYKSPNVNDEMKGKIILESVQIREDDIGFKITILSILPNNNINFSTLEKGKETVQKCLKFVLSLEHLKQLKSWAHAIRVNISLKDIHNKYALNIPKTRKGTSNRAKNKNYRASFNGNGNTPNPKKKQPTKVSGGSLPDNKTPQANPPPATVN
eukprot:TRINITY_DN4939_c0_g1_i1.p1 TRINITY_DN4939_c0_g1~~TRINITY_DN4939_c0_g1_i1.p1  ORF type:complete len:605 (-),score=168.64 TRINITY_DN4939_c0_g1_i1:66-1880(-)